MDDLSLFLTSVSLLKARFKAGGVDAVKETYCGPP